MDAEPHDEFIETLEDHNAAVERGDHQKADELAMKALPAPKQKTKKQQVP